MIEQSDTITAGMKQALKMLWEGVYQMPVYLNYGVHWALTPFESENLTAATVNALNSVPSKSRKQMMEFLNNYVPLTTFLATIAVITYPRVLQTQMQRSGRDRKSVV